MAGNANSGRIVNFPMKEHELEAHIENYKNQVISGELARPNWSHFCSTLDRTEAEIADVMALADSPQSGYKNRAILLRRAATWIRGQVLELPGWSSGNSSKAIFMLKQDLGDGVSWSDKDSGPSGPVNVKVSFGGDDARGKKASK